MYHNILYYDTSIFNNIYIFKSPKSNTMAHRTRSKYENLILKIGCIFRHNDNVIDVDEFKQIIASGAIEPFEILIPQLKEDFHFKLELILCQKRIDENSNVNDLLDLLSNLSDLNKQLILACIDNNIPAVKLLLTQNINVYLTENLPLRLAIQNNHYEIVEMLLDHPDMREQVSAFHGIALSRVFTGNLSIFGFQDHTRILKLLLNKGVDTENIVSDGFRLTALVMAILSIQVDLYKRLGEQYVKILLDNIPRERIHYGNDLALYKAIFVNNTFVVEMLLKHGAKTENIGPFGDEYALEIAAEEQKFDLVKLFVSYGAKIHSRRHSIQRNCWFCDKLVTNSKIYMKKKSLCSKCGIARYCSVECKTKNWPDHVSVCSIIGEYIKTDEFVQ